MIVTVKHTSVPWKADLELILDSTGKEVARTNYKIRIEAYANAAFIVRACNNHDELLAACKEAVEALKTVHDEMPLHRCTIDCPDIHKHVAALDAAVRKAEEE